MASDSDSDKVFYSIETSPTSGITPLPAGTTCKMCGCTSNAHAVYWKCPLLGTFICSNCCQEEVPLEANLPQIQKLTSCTSLSSVCGPCGRNTLRDNSL